MNSTNKIQIRRLSIQNFKASSPEQPWVFNFSMGHGQSGSIDLFGGPNGYGKTTAFEAIQICITGRLSLSLDPQLHNKDGVKMPYVNDIAHDVLLKLELVEESSNGRIHHVIGRRYSKNNDGRWNNERRNKAPNFHFLLEAFYSQNSSEFDQDENPGIFDERNKLEPEKLNYDLQRLLFEDKVEVGTGFSLLNYCSQANNLRYLAASERSKRDQISFLFKTEEEEALINISNQTVRDLKELLSVVTDEITKLNEVDSKPAEGDSIGYRQIFPSKDYAWDLEAPFSNIKNKSQEQLAAWRSDISELKEWIQRFDHNELLKSEQKNILSLFIANQNNVLAFVAKGLTEEAILADLKSAKEKIEALSSALAKLQNWQKADPDELIGSLRLGNLITTDLDVLRANLFVWKTLGKQSSDASRAKTIVINSREELLKKYRDLHDATPQGGQCPLCGYDHRSFELLIQSITDHALEISKANSDLDNEIEGIQTQIRGIIDKAESAAKQELSREELVRKSDLYKWIVKLNPQGYNTRFQEVIDASKWLQIEFNIPEINGSESIREFEAYTQTLISKLSDNLDGLTIDVEKTARPELFKTLFERNPDLLNQVKPEYFDEKLMYLESQFRSEISAKLSLLRSRKDILERVISKLDAKATMINLKIKEYKSRMIRLLQIPMYVYSAKILQNCPQGEGIFVVDNESNNALRFRIDNINRSANRSDHDIAYHLSTGQLSVVAISFLLAINKLADTPFKFVGIDDPLQTLDDLNVHALVEVLRHDFGGLQFLFSTHEDDAAKFLYYRFKKAKFETNYTDIRESYFAMI